MTKPKRGFFFVTCVKCRCEIDFGDAPSFEDELAPKSSSVTLNCPQCGAEYTYPPSEIQRAYE